MQRRHEDRPDEVELLLDAQRPQVKKRFRRRIGAEIAPDPRQPQEPEIDGEIRVAEQAAADVAELDRRGAEPADDPDRGDHEQQGGQDALGPLGVEHRKREMADGAFGQDDARNQKAGNDEEYVDTGKAARQKRPIGMESDHPEDRKRTQPIDVLTEIEVAPAPCGGEVGRVEGLVHQGFRERFAKL